MARSGWKRNPRLKANIDKIVNALPKRAAVGASAALQANGEEAEAIIKGDVPVDDGTLRDSVGWKFGDPPPGTLGIRDAIAQRGRARIPEHLRISIFAGGKKAPHAHLVHNGTKSRERKDGRGTGIMPPQPFFWPNIRSLRKRFKSRISRAVNKALKGRA